MEILSEFLRALTRLGYSGNKKCPHAILPATAQQPIHCPSGEVRNRIDEKELSIQYSGQEITSTLGTLSFMGARFTVAPKALQTAAAATQVWNEYLKGLAVAWNACVITKDQYAEALQKLYPSMKGDASEIEKMRGLLAENQRVDERRLRALLEIYVDKLQRFAEISGREKLFQQMSVLADEVQGTRADIRLGREENRHGFEDVQSKLEELDRAVASLSKPQEVTAKISALKSKMLARADEAEAEYNRGYENLNAFRTSDAVQNFERAFDLVPLPDFSLALGTALRLLPDLNRSGQVLAAGLALASQAHDAQIQTGLASQLGIVLFLKGDLKGAQALTERALSIDEQAFGPIHPTVAIHTANLGEILRAKGDLKGAQKQTERSLVISEKLYGFEAPTVAVVAGNLGLILRDKGDLKGAQEQTERALRIDEKVYGPEHPTVATEAGNLGVILKDKGDLKGAQEQTERALRIDERIYGPNYPTVAIHASFLGLILLEKSDLVGAQKQIERALVCRI